MLSKLTYVSKWRKPFFYCTWKYFWFSNDFIWWFFRFPCTFMVILIRWFFLEINTCFLDLLILVLRLWYYCFCLRIWNVLIWEVYNLKYFTICKIRFYCFKGWIKYAIKWTKRNTYLQFKYNIRNYFRYIFILIAICNNRFH